MNITDAAKAQLEALLKENKADGLMMQIATSCCGASPMFSLAVFFRVGCSFLLPFRSGLQTD